MAEDPLSILCVEPRFPGRLGAVADWLVRRRGYRCYFYCQGADDQSLWPASTGNGLEVQSFNVGGIARDGRVDWTRSLERGLCYAYGLWEALINRRPWPLDLILGRTDGLGSTLFLNTIFPGIPIVNRFDYYLHPHSHDVAAEADSSTPQEYFLWRRSANTMDLLDFENGVIPWSPTEWQKSLFPSDYRSDIHALFDGVNISGFGDEPQRIPSSRYIGNRPIPDDVKVVTYVSRELERTRGFERFAHLAKEVLSQRDDVLFVAVGSPTVTRTFDIQWFESNFANHVLQSEGLHQSDRFWCLGQVPPVQVRQILLASDLHVYPSRPYITSRSLVEAMGAGCTILGWDSDPVREFLTDGKNAILVSPDEPEKATKAALKVLSSPEKFTKIAKAAAKDAREKFSQDACIPKLARFFDSVVAKAGGPHR